MATHFKQRSGLLIDLLGFGMTRWSTFGIHANRFLFKASELTLDFSDVSFTEREEIVLCHRLADRSSQNCQSLGICSRAA